MIPTLEWLPDGVNFLDQTKLPFEETYLLATDYKQVATVINQGFAPLRDWHLDQRRHSVRSLELPDPERVLATDIRE